MFLFIFLRLYTVHNQHTLPGLTLYRSVESQGKRCIGCMNIFCYHKFTTTMREKKNICFHAFFRITSSHTHTHTHIFYQCTYLYIYTYMYWHFHPPVWNSNKVPYSPTLSPPAQNRMTYPLTHTLSRMKSMI